MARGMHRIDHMRMKTRWTLAETAVQFCVCGEHGLGFCCSTAPALAEENATAYEALRVVGREVGRDALHQIVSITGSRGDPQPDKWKIIVEDPEGRGFRELNIVDGKIDSDHTADRDVAGSTEGATIDVSRLNLDSSGAYALASHTAEASHANFATADYTLRTDDRGEPMWIVTLRRQIVTPDRHDLHRRDWRHRHANGRDVFRCDDGGRRERL